MKTPAAAVILAGLAAGCSSKPADTKVELKGKTLLVEWIRSDPDRMATPGAHAKLAGDRGFMVGYGHDRIQHHHSAKGTAGYDVAWLSQDGRIVETASLPANSEAGVTSTKEARYALFLAPDWLKTQGAAVGDAASLGAGIAANPPVPLPEIRVGGVPVRVELSTTREERQRGLMHRRSLSKEDGMLFLFRSPRPQSFWMGHCHFPLDIAFFDATGRFLNVVPALPYPDPNVDPDPANHPSSAGEAKYVLEVNLGWFQAKGLTDAAGRALKPITLDLPGFVRDAEGKADP